jgi:hypothetical protein
MARTAAAPAHVPRPGEPTRRRVRGRTGSPTAPLLVAPLTAATPPSPAPPWLSPRPLPASTSAGFGDRLGLATPGHVRALRAAGGSITPVFAQQSIREMTRAARSPQAVLDDATWGSFEGGWRDGQGADADHLKTADDITACAAAGFTMFTIDPGEHVSRGHAGVAELRAAFDALPWAAGRQPGVHARDWRAVPSTSRANVSPDEPADQGGRGAAPWPTWRCSATSARRPALRVGPSTRPTPPLNHMPLRDRAAGWGCVGDLAPRFVGERGHVGDVAAFDAVACTRRSPTFGPTSSACIQGPTSSHLRSPRFTRSLFT